MCCLQCHDIWYIEKHPVWQQISRYSIISNIDVCHITQPSSADGDGGLVCCGIARSRDPLFKSTLTLFMQSQDTSISESWDANWSSKNNLTTRSLLGLQRHEIFTVSWNPVYSIMQFLSLLSVRATWTGLYYNFTQLSYHSIPWKPCISLQPYLLPTFQLHLHSLLYIAHNLSCHFTVLVPGRTKWIALLVPCRPEPTRKQGSPPVQSQASEAACAENSVLTFCCAACGNGSVRIEKHFFFFFCRKVPCARESVCFAPTVFSRVNRRAAMCAGCCWLSVCRAARNRVWSERLPSGRPLYVWLPAAAGST